jgi:hypothetical protein
MIRIVLHRSFLLVIACSDGMQWDLGDTGVSVRLLHVSQVLT